MQQQEEICQNERFLRLLNYAKKQERQTKIELIYFIDLKKERNGFKPMLVYPKQMSTHEKTLRENHTVLLII